MNRNILILSAALVPAALLAFSLPEKATIKLSADKVAADRVTGNLVASGHVHAVSGPFSLKSSKVEKIGNVYHFCEPTTVSTCTNHNGICHWSLTGEVKYADGKEVEARNMTLKIGDIPVFWIPYWWQPLETDYGWRVMPGYRSRWGAFVLTKYVYDITDGFREKDWGLRGNTRFDLRTENGVALGQSVRWKLGDWGKGKFKVYYLNDLDADRYDRNWTNSRKHNYANWGSEVKDDRYALSFEHVWEATEQDIVKARMSYYSDSYFLRDFLKDANFGLDNRYPTPERNEIAWEHMDDTFGVAVSASGPLNEFYGGVMRLPEVFVDVAPQPFFGLPVNYESSTRFGWLNRNYAKLGGAGSYDAYRYRPGLWGDYQAFRADTYHRFTKPFRIADAISAVPRFGVRGTYWSASGREILDGKGRAGSKDDDVTRAIVEGGITFSARGTAMLSDGWQHLVEPYLDVLAQEAFFSGLGRNERALMFDSVDGSSDWLDQFAGRSRNLPYSWYGVTPGLRNAFRKADAEGRMRTVFDIDVYAALQFNDTSWTQGGRYHRLSANQEDPNYGRDGDVTVIPGFRARYYPKEDITVAARAEWDGENDTLAYADVALAKKFSRNFTGNLSYSGRNHRWWDFSSVPFDPDRMRDEGFNWMEYSYAGAGFEHEINETFAWGPFVRWDLEENELDEVGTWVDIRYCCLGFRLGISYEKDFVRIDGSKADSDFRFYAGVYLRALGSSMTSLFGD